MLSLQRTWKNYNLRVQLSLVEMRICVYKSSQYIFTHLVAYLVINNVSYLAAFEKVLTFLLE